MKSLGFVEVYDLSGGIVSWKKWQQKEAFLRSKTLKKTGKERIINIDAKKFEFSTSQIKVKKNEKILIKVTNIDGIHGINIPALGQKSDAELVLDTSQKGVFPFGCNNLCGIGHLSMKGQIIIE